MVCLILQPHSHSSQIDTIFSSVFKETVPSFHPSPYPMSHSAPQFQTKSNPPQFQTKMYQCRLCTDARKDYYACTGWCSLGSEGAAGDTLVRAIIGAKNWTAKARRFLRVWRLICCKLHGQAFHVLCGVYLVRCFACVRIRCGRIGCGGLRTRWIRSLCSRHLQFVIWLMSQQSAQQGGDAIWQCEGRMFIYSPELIRESRRLWLRDEALWIDHNCSHTVELHTSFATASNVVWLQIDDLHHIKKCQK